MNISATPLPKNYAFIVSGYKLTFTAVAKDDAGKHPLDILETDLREIVERSGV